MFYFDECQRATRKSTVDLARLVLFENLWRWCFPTIHRDHVEYGIVKLRFPL